jgi:hypothetical protein
MRLHYEHEEFGKCFGQRAGDEDKGQRRAASEHFARNPAGCASQQENSFQAGRASLGCGCVDGDFSSRSVLPSSTGRC